MILLERVASVESGYKERDTVLMMFTSECANKYSNILQNSILYVSDDSPNWMIYLVKYTVYKNKSVKVN